jgi:hypothetical protein
LQLQADFLLLQAELARNDFYERQELTVIYH